MIYVPHSTQLTKPISFSLFLNLFIFIEIFQETVMITVPADAGMGATIRVNY